MKSIVVRLATLAAFVLSLAWPASAIDISQTSADQSLGADQETFLSLTRTPERIGELPSNISVITQKDIQRSHAKTLDEVLSTVPGVNVSRSGTLGSFSRVQMRGSTTGGQVQIVIDDQPYLGMTEQFTDLSLIPLDDVERIEIVRGGSSVIYGANTIGGVIHVITKRHYDNNPELSAGVESRSFKTTIGRAEAGATTHGIDVRATGSRYTSGGFQDNGDTAGTTGSAAVGYTFGNGARVSANASNVVQRSGNPQGTSVPIAEWDGTRERAPFDANARVQNEVSYGRVMASAPIGDRGEVQSTFFGTHQIYHNQPHNPFLTDTGNTDNVYGNDTRVRLPFGLMVGETYERDEDESVNGGVGVAGAVNDLGTYIQQTVRFGRWNIVPALRYDHHSTFGGTLNPRLSAAVAVNDRLSLSGNVARSFRAPTFQDLFYSNTFAVANPDLRPELAWSYDLGAELHQGRNRAQVTGFFTQIHDRMTPVIIGSVTVPPFGPIPVSQAQNKPSAEISGVEADVAGGAGPVSADVNYTYQRAMGNSATSAKFVPLRLTPTHQINGQVTWTSPWKTTASVIGRYVSRQLTADGSFDNQMPPYAVWGTRLGQRVGPAEVFAGIDNVFDRHYATSFEFGNVFDPQPGRTTYAGVNLTFR